MGLFTGVNASGDEIFGIHFEATFGIGGVWRGLGVGLGRLGGFVW